MGATTLDYSNVIDSLTDYYGVSSAQAWNVINSYDLTPAQVAELLPKETIAQTADGIYRLYNNAGEVTGYVNQTTVSTALVPSEVSTALNSNVQSGTAATTVQTRWAGNSVIDQSGKVKTSAGVTKYEGGVAQQSPIPAIVGNVVPAAAAAIVGIANGKKVASRFYNGNPAFWNSLGLDTLDPTTWNILTCDMEDTGVEGAIKTGINCLLGINPNGETQAYMSEDAYNYLTWALAKAGAFTAAESTATYPPALYLALSNFWNNPATILTDTLYTTSGSAGSGWGTMISEVSGSGTVYTVVAAVQNGNFYNLYMTFVSQSPFSVTYTNYPRSGGNPSVYTVTASQSGNWYHTYTTMFDTSIAYPAANYSYRQASPSTVESDAVSIIANSTIEQGEAIDGMDTQTGATTPTGIGENSSLQDVASAIRSQYPDLYNNRVEQTVVQPDGTTKTIVYYPVPMPNNTTDTSVSSPTTITIDQPLTVVLPEGTSITLPDGTVIHGDGTTPIDLPAGTYTLPSGTIIKNQYVYDDDNTQGGSQADPTVDDSSTTALKDLIIALITSLGLSPQSITAPDTTSDTDTPTENMNPPDTGGGLTPPIVVPVGSASALWSVYNPTLSEVNQLGAWLWSNNFIDQLLKMFNDPMQAIIGLHATFIQPITGSAQNIKVGYLDSGVSALTVPTQYSTMDCGSVNLQEYFGNVFDYSPYTRVYIYLPFIGFKELDVSQVMRSRIGVKYHGDAYTGTGLCEVTVTRDAGAGGVLYSYGCECAVRYPLSQGSYMGMAGAIAGTALGIASGNVAPALLGFMNARMDVDHSGGFSGNSGAMGIKKPYLVVMRPQTAMANNYKHFTGAPSNANVKVGSCSGYIRCKEVHVEGLSAATNEEKTMVENALKTGIIVS